MNRDPGPDQERWCSIPIKASLGAVMLKWSQIQLGKDVLGLATEKVGGFNTE